MLFNKNITKLNESLKVLAYYQNKANHTLNLANLEEYFKIHQSIFMNKNFSAKKITFNKNPVQNGYANQLYSFISALLIAIITDSQFVFENEFIKNYTNPPLKMFDNINEEIGLSIIQFKKSIYKVKAKQAWLPHKNIDDLTSTVIPDTFLRYIYDSPEAFFMEICTNPIYFDKLFSYNLVKAETLNSAVDSLIFRNIDENQKLESLFRVGFEVGGNLLNACWIPSEAISKEIKDYLENEFKDSYVIGFQIRSEYLPEKEIYLNKFIDCALDLESIYLKSNKNSKKIKWFISSETEQDIDYIKNDYKSKTHNIINTYGKLFHASLDSIGYKRAIADSELLSKCDEIIVTGGSTFGWVPAMKMLKLPFYINVDDSAEKCSKARLSKPPVKYLNGFLYRFLRYIRLLSKDAVF